jgi:hypothetical protein
MFNLDEKIAEWRRQMLAANVKAPEPLNELEGHLREDIRILVLAGISEEQAFQQAVSRLGQARAVGAEFNKIQTLASRVARFGLLFLIALSAAVVAFRLIELAGGGWQFVSAAKCRSLITARSANFGGSLHGKWGFLLLSHIMTVTVGYVAAFLPGGIAVYYFYSLRPSRQPLPRWSISLFSYISAGLVAVGMLLGTLWLKLSFGSDIPASPRELAGGCAFVWLIAFWATQQFTRLRDDALALLCLAGNTVIALAWFAPYLNYWPVKILLGVHFIFLVMAMTPTMKAVES